MLVTANSAGEADSTAAVARGQRRFFYRGSLSPRSFMRISHAIELGLPAVEFNFLLAGVLFAAAGVIALLVAISTNKQLNLPHR